MTEIGLRVCKGARRTVITRAGSMVLGTSEMETSRSPDTGRTRKPREMDDRLGMQMKDLLSATPFRMVRIALAFIGTQTALITSGACEISDVPGFWVCAG
jgi:hypothetical protein